MAYDQVAFALELSRYNRVYRVMFAVPTSDKVANWLVAAFLPSNLPDMAPPHIPVVSRVLAQSNGYVCLGPFH